MLFNGTYSHVNHSEMQWPARSFHQAENAELDIYMYIFPQQHLVPWQSIPAVALAFSKCPWLSDQYSDGLPVLLTAPV